MTHNPIRSGGLFICFVTLLLSGMVIPVRAPALNINADANGNLSPPWVVVGVDPAVPGATFQWTVSLNPVPAAVAPLFDIVGELVIRFSEWNLALSPFSFGGTLNVTRYDAKLGIGNPPAWNIPFDFEVQYSNKTGFKLAAGHVLQWIQFVTTTRPTPAGKGALGTRAGVPYLDPYDYDWDRVGARSNSGTLGLSDGTPFYWNDSGNSERAAHTVLGKPPAGGGTNVTRFDFTDQPWRYLVQALVGDPVTWEAYLYLVDYNLGPPKSVVIDPDGVRWGFSITRVPVAVAPPAGPQYDKGGVGGDKYDGGWGTPINATLAHVCVPVGGISVPVDKFGLLTPYIGLTSTIMVATVATAIYVKHVKRRKEKQ